MSPFAINDVDDGDHEKKEKEKVGPSVVLRIPNVSRDPLRHSH